MPRVAKEMSALSVGRLQQPGLHFVGGVKGLVLRVTPAGGRSWVLRLTVAGRRRDMGLGGFPTVPLTRARELGREAHELIRQGVDPFERRREARQALEPVEREVLPTFRDCATAYIEAHGGSWKNAKHLQQWRNTMTQYVYPLIGDLPVRDVGKEHVLAVLTPLWSTKTETAVRIRGRIELVLSYAMQANQRPEGLNPARWKGGLDKLLPPPGKVSKVDHHPALAIDEVPAFMAALHKQAGVGARALEFVVLTAARSGEVRGATWDEVDLAARTWTIPAQRMKAGREHRVALSDAAVALLNAMRQMPRGRDKDWVFAGWRDGMLSDMTLTAVMRRMKLKAVPHGFRSTFRDWVAERTSYTAEVAEMALAHAIDNKVEAAYRRGDLFEKRMQMMRDWAAFVLPGGYTAHLIS